MGARTPAAGATDAPPGPTPQSLRARLGALRNLPPFLKLVWQTNPGLTLAQCVLRLIRALLPVATLYVGKLIIDEVVGLTQMPNAPASLREWLDLGLLDRIGVAVGARVRAGRAVRRAGTRGVAARFRAVRAVQQRDQPAPDGARGHARPRGLRGQRVAGPPRTSAAAGRRPHDADGAAVRAGAGRRDDRELRRRPHRLCAMAHRAARDRARAGLHRRGAFQRAELFAQLRAHARAARARLRPPDRHQRRIGEGSEDLRAQRLPDRALPHAGETLLRCEPAGSRCGARPSAAC